MLLSYPVSPRRLDLNGIENSLAILRKHIEELGPEAKEELIDTIITAWEGIKMFLVNKLVDPMPERFEGLMGNEGGHISY
jgi:hypothetical protein